jgi:tRNA(fMet)-specific endonuclease VapC
VHLLDTDTLTWLHNWNPRVVERLHTLEDPDVGTTIITKIELLRGRFEFLLKAAAGNDLLRAQQSLARTEELLSQIMVVPFDERAAEQFDRLNKVKGLKNIGRADLLIGSIALAHGPGWLLEMFVTSNKFQV